MLEGLWLRGVYETAELKSYSLAFWQKGINAWGVNLLTAEAFVDFISSDRELQTKDVPAVQLRWLDLEDTVTAQTLFDRVGGKASLVTPEAVAGVLAARCHDEGQQRLVFFISHPTDADSVKAVFCFVVPDVKIRYQGIPLYPRWVVLLCSLSDPEALFIGGYEVFLGGADLKTPGL